MEEFIKHNWVIRKLVKLIIIPMLFPIIIFIITVISLFGYGTVDRIISSKIMYNYATDYQYNYDVFFGNEAIKMGHVDEIINKVIETKKKPNEYFLNIKADRFNRTDIIFLKKNEKYFLQQVEESSFYLKYLSSKNLEVEDLERYVERMATFGDGIITAFQYIIMLLIALMAYACFKVKNYLFMVAGIVYTFLTVDYFTSGFLVATVYRIFNIHKLIDGITFKYMMESLIPIKEAMLTFIIFEAIKVCKNKKSGN
ncbi:hypothetical protein SDC9_117989 [bioreactor metagenome]|uniref:Uncharacterized protein n=1 Tax=bioreactor metagenome TaxID=1076179 RepID=A0A645BZN3_9ZZZZ